MLKKLLEGLGSKKAKLNCPECGAENDTNTAWNSLITCRDCGIKASRSEWLKASDVGSLRGKVGRPPTGTKIQVTRDGVGCMEVVVPATRKFGFLIFFGLMWCIIIALISGGFLLALLNGEGIEGGLSEWWLIPFFGVFWAVGIGTLYVGLRQMFARHRFTVTNGALTMRRTFFGRVSEKSLACDSIASISQREFYKQNYKPVYGIEVRGSDGKIRFGTSLREEEKAWLVAELEDAVFPKVEQQAASGSILEPMKVGVGSNGRTIRSDAFSIVIPSSAKHLVGLGAILLSMGGAFSAAGIFAMADEGWIGFRGIWTLISSAMVLGGFGVLVFCLLSRGQERRIEGNDIEISLRTYKRGLIFKDVSFPRSEVTDIRASRSGQSNGTVMKRVELIVGDRAEVVCRWLDETQADQLVRQVRGKA